jgi:hypothetical protein
MGNEEKREAGGQGEFVADFKFFFILGLFFSGMLNQVIVICFFLRPTPKNLIGITSAKQGRFLKVFKSAKRASILDLSPGRLWEERRASAGGLWHDQIDQSSPR